MFALNQTGTKKGLIYVYDLWQNGELMTAQDFAEL